jgi:hypothetical protein
MIHHVSIPARDPVKVAQVLAELMQGRAFPFSGPLPGAQMAVSGDAHGTMIEVYPETVVMTPGEGEAPVAYRRDAPPAAAAPFHILLSTPLGRAAVEALGAREGWRTRFFDRAAPGRAPAFSVIEFWVENRILIEVAPVDLIGTYERYMQLDRLAAMAAEAS